MPNRLQKSRPRFAIHQDEILTDPEPIPLSNDRLPRPTLTPASLGAMNTKAMANGTPELARDSKPLPTVPPAPANGPDPPRRMASTIRPVPSLDERGRPSLDDDMSSEWSPSIPHSASAFSSSLNSNASALSAASQHLTPSNGADPRPTVRLKPGTPNSHLDGASPSMENLALPPPRAPGPVASRPRVDVPLRESSLGVTGRSHASAIVSQEQAATSNGTGRPAHPPGDSGDGLSLSATEAHLSNGWDSTVGKAGLGKTGRVINRLVSDNEALKRDIKIEKLKADESKQAARLIEDKMDRLTSEYESLVLDASVTKTLLSRKERQVESLQAAVELEKGRAVDARDKERTWREELERVRCEAKRQVEQANSHAALMDGRYNAISSHWRDQGEEVKRALGRMRQDVAALLEERASDDDKINTLRELCDQQDGNIRDLRRQNQDVTRKFDEYRAEQENALREIKTKAAEREAEQLRTLEETREVLHKLKWSLKVKENVRGAQ